MFTRMDQGTADDWRIILDVSRAHGDAMPDRVLDMLGRLSELRGDFLVDQLTHCLQTATFAERAGAPEDMVLAALCHDMGKVISIRNHGPIAAEILFPYVSEETYQIIRTHQLFEGRHYFRFWGDDPDARNIYAAEPWFARAEQFADEWDQVAFDPHGETFPLEHFEPLVRKLFSRAHEKQGRVTGGTSAARKPTE